MSKLNWWFEPDWKLECCSKCGADIWDSYCDPDYGVNIWYSSGDPDHKLCFNCFYEQQKSEPKQYIDPMCDICEEYKAIDESNGYYVCSDECAQKAKEKEHAFANSEIMEYNKHCNKTKQ